MISRWDSNPQCNPVPGVIPFRLKGYYPWTYLLLDMQLNLKGRIIPLIILRDGKRVFNYANIRIYFKFSY
jgi:hypothetical protein